MSYQVGTKVSLKLTDWIVQQKNIEPEITGIIARVTAKAIQLSVDDQLEAMWLPISQIEESTTLEEPSEEFVAELKKSSLEFYNGGLLVKCHYEDSKKAKAIPHSDWCASEKGWYYPLLLDAYEQIKETFPNIEEAKEVTEAIYKLKQRDRLIRQALRSKWRSDQPLEPVPVKTQLYAHQVHAYNLGIQIPTIALLMEQGTGKTLTALSIAGRRFIRNEVKRVLIVCPSSAMHVWGNEVARFADFPHDTRLLQGTMKKRIQVLDEWERDESTLQIAVINYEIIRKTEMEEKVKEWSPDMIVIDESHKIKQHDAKQSMAMHRLSKIAEYRIIATGTPVANKPLDFFSQYLFLEPRIFGYDYYAFRKRYAVLGGYGNHQVIGYKNLDDLTGKAHRIAYRVRKEEALDLPETVDQVLYCELEPKARKIYNDFEKVAYALIEEREKQKKAAKEGENFQGKEIHITNILTELLRLSQVTGGFVGNQSDFVQASEAKMKLFEEKIEDLLDAGKKVVVFARFRPEVDAISQLLSRKSIDHVVLAGGSENRGDLVERFQNHEGCKVFVGQLQAAGESITLTAADTAIFYSFDYNFVSYDQARSRIHRIGQANKCTYIHLVAMNTIDEDILEALREKKDMADLLVDDWKKLFKKVKKQRGKKKA
jgi:SNF2 family DNA or RNA helicase